MGSSPSVVGGVGGSPSGSSGAAGAGDSSAGTSGSGDSWEERSSLRGLERTFGISRKTVSTWLKKNSLNYHHACQTRTKPDPSDSNTIALELDELWSFVIKKANKRWIWIALCRRTRQVVAYVIGDRSETTCRKLREYIPESYRHGLCYTDFWQAYQLVIRQ
ncbi:MAG: hypothetical protein BRC39_16840 [Cyanobacteria bacterium QH_7_48_89]|nr:MAG: hypothetical protein BRC39_16840 [Cyanobacteria bacterium QH_7_48_89]PSO75135.1 MAG: hypothetical protein BRC42_01045 [Cyanobacteria bacterium QS_1_48_34]